MDIVVWLRSLGLGKYEAAFRENDIDETVLPSLTHENLKELGVASLGHRRKLLDAIAALRTDADLKELGISSPGHRKRLLAGIAEKGLAAPTNTVRTSTFSEGERRQVTILFADLCGIHRPVAITGSGRGR